MPMPKKRHSSVRKGKRRVSNYQLSSKSIARCPGCGDPVLPHHACPTCGNYRGRPAIKIKDKKGKKEKK